MCAKARASVSSDEPLLSLAEFYQIRICLRKLLITNGSEVNWLRRRLVRKPGSAAGVKLFFNFVVLC